MKPEEVPSELVEKAAREVTNYLHRSGDWIPPQHYQIARNALAAVMLEIQAEAWTQGAKWVLADQQLENPGDPWVTDALNRHNPHHVARLTATTGEPTT